MKRVFASIGFSIAIAFLVLNQINIEYIVYIIIGLAFLFIASLIIDRFRKNIIVPLCVGIVFLSSVFFSFYYDLHVTPQLKLDGIETSISFYYDDIPKVNDNGYTYSIKTTNINVSGAPQEISLNLRTENEIKAEPYQLLRANAKLNKISNNANDSYGNWAKDVFLSTKIDSYAVTDIHVKPILKSLYNIRNDVINTMLNAFDGYIGALSVALLTGYKGYLSDELYSKFKFAGAAHIIAVSGFHLTILTALLFYFFKRIRIPSLVRSLIGIVLIVVCAAVGGFSKSIIRAGIMLGVVLFGDFFNRKSDSLNSLGIAITIICFNPFAVTDVGFLLSVLSVFAIILLQLSIKLKRWAKPFLIPISVLIFTMPVMYLYFGYFTLGSVLSNVVVAPLGSTAIALSLISYMSIKLNFLTTVFTFIARVILELLINVISFVSSFKIFVINLPDDFGIIIAGVLVIFAFVYFLGNIKLLKPAGIITSIIAVAFIVYSSITSFYSTEMLVTKSGAVAVRNKDYAVVYGVHNSYDYQNVKTFLIDSYGEVDAIIIKDTEKSVKYSLSLAESFGCHEIVSQNFESSFFETENLESINITNSYKSSNDDIKVNLNFDNFEVNIGDFSYNTNDLSNIYLDDDNDLIYTINSSSYNIKTIG